MKYFVVKTRLATTNKGKYFYIEADNDDLAMIEAARRVGNNDFKIFPAIPECEVTPETTNIYLCTLDNGQEYDFYADYTITVTGKDMKEARKNALEKFNGKIWGIGFGDKCIKSGGTLSINLEYKNVILEKKI